MPVVREGEVSIAARYVARVATEELEGGSADPERGILQVRGPVSTSRFIDLGEPRACPNSCAVDGGSTIVLDCGSFVVGAVSVGHVVAGEAGSILEARSELRLITASQADKASAYRELFRNLMGAEPTDQPSTLESLVSRVRNLLELREAGELVAKVTEGTIVMIDGALWAGLRDLAPLIERTARTAAERGVCLMGVSKRSMLYAGHRPLVPYLSRLGRKALGERLWAYPVDLREYEDRVFGATYVAHLHPVSRFSFRVDVNPTPSVGATGALAMLASLSDDPGYLGYPYPLARVHNEVAISGELRGELERSLKRALASEGADVSLIEDYASDFHRILDGGA
jgi:hypothetical protein